MPRNRSKRDAKRVSLAERRAKALQLRIGGATLDAIASTLGYAQRANAMRDIDKAIDSITRPDALSLVKVEMERLDAMQLSIWLKAKAGDFNAIDRLLKIMQRRAKLLGLDAPTRAEHTGANGGPIVTTQFAEMTDEELEDYVARARAGADE